MDPYQQILETKAQDLSQINERVRLYFKSGQRNYDDFDDILLQITLYQLSRDSPLKDLGDEIDRLDDIQALFERRATNKEFPAVKFIVYL